MWTDPIIEEIHRVREAHAHRFDFDLKAIAEDIKRIEQAMKIPPVSLPPKPVQPKRPVA